MVRPARAFLVYSKSNQPTDLRVERLEDRRFLSATSWFTSQSVASGTLATYLSSGNLTQMSGIWGVTAPVLGPFYPLDETIDMILDCPHPEVCPPSIPYQPPGLGETEYTPHLPEMDLW